MQELELFDKEEESSSAPAAKEETSLTSSK